MRHRLHAAGAARRAAGAGLDHPRHPRGAVVSRQLRAGPSGHSGAVRLAVSGVRDLPLPRRHPPGQCTGTTDPQLDEGRHHHRRRYRRTDGRDQRWRPPGQHTDFPGAGQPDLPVPDVFGVVQRPDRARALRPQDRQLRHGAGHADRHLHRHRRGRIQDAGREVGHHRAGLRRDVELPAIQCRLPRPGRVHAGRAHRGDCLRDRLRRHHRRPVADAARR